MRWWPVAAGFLAVAAIACDGNGGAKNDGGGGSGAGSGGSGAASGGSGGSFAAVEALLMDNCSFCHAGGGSILPSSMSLTVGGAYDALVNVDAEQCVGMGAGRKRVAPGSPATSYIIDKLKGTNLCAGVQMPRTAAPLAAGDIATVEAWIAAGAPR